MRRENPTDQSAPPVTEAELAELEQAARRYLDSPYEFADSARAPLILRLIAEVRAARAADEERRIQRMTDAEYTEMIRAKVLASTEKHRAENPRPRPCRITVEPAPDVPGDWVAYCDEHDGIAQGASAVSALYLLQEAQKIAAADDAANGFEPRTPCPEEAIVAAADAAIEGSAEYRRDLDAAMADAMASVECGSGLSTPDEVDSWISALAAKETP